MTEIQRLARVLAKAVIGDATHVDKVDDYALRHYAEGVRALLLEIRKPSNAMVLACGSGPMRPETTWPAMIDELRK
jgi:hypothetical protein